MADDGLGPIDLTGRWVGFYRYRLHELGTFPITAEVRQECDRITGEMYDQITSREELLDTLIEANRDDLSPGRRLRLEASIRRFGVGEVIVNSRLPETSDIEGKVADGLVEFTKAYRGASEVEWSVGGKQIGSETRRGHKVHYSGRLDREVGCIAGEWVIRRRGLFGRFLPPEARGGFELYRKS
ncbi:MAG: hypothetical protein JWN86_1374 [Planctomycetota bacterium]|nr:hypothetical protein [Planctomycetota bacterium]